MARTKLFLYTAEGAREPCNLVITVRLKLRNRHVAQADLLRNLGQPLYRAKDKDDQDGIDGKEDHGKDPGQRNHKSGEHALRPMERKLHGRGHDLGGLHVVQLPTEAVVFAVVIEHGAGRPFRCVIALQTGRVLQSHGARNVKRPAVRRVAFADQLVTVGVLPEVADQVGLPVRRAVHRVGRIQGGFLVGIIRELLAKLAEYSLAENAGTDCGRNEYFICVSSNGLIWVFV